MRSAIIVVYLISVINAKDYHYENYKVYNFEGAESEPSRKPWFFEEYADAFNPPKSGGYVQSDNAYESVAEQKLPEVYENPAEAYFVASTKKIPNEDKSFKKAISPFYTLTASDPEKYKSIILKSGAPYCQEIKNPKPAKRFRRDAMTCYKCKDPKNGATYEQCSSTYTSANEPQATVQHERYVPLAASLRYRRSNVNPVPVTTGVEDKENYRFGEEYFTPPVIAAEATSESKKNPEKCEKVFKDSMVCMVCTNPETHGKYEQCSYTNQPDDKSYAYSKSSSFGLPHSEKDIAESKTKERSAPKKESEEEIEEEHPELDKYFEEQTAQIKSRTPKQRSYEPDVALESGSENVKDGQCKKVSKDNMVCMICKDPKTGGNYEQCSYAHNPSDKVYKVSKSKSFGYPEADKEAAKSSSSPYESGSYYGSAGSEEDSGDKYNYDQPSEKQETQEYVPYKFDEGPYKSAEYVKSESERISEQVKADETNCKKVNKDSMTCTVCTDPKTGGKSEQCSYAYEPNDKLFSFSRAKSFGSPEEAESEETGSPGSSAESYTDQGSYGVASDNKPYVAGEEASPSDKKEQAEALEFFNTSAKKKEIQKVLSEFQQEDRSKCKKVIRDKLTCFQCADKDGVQKEECIFVAAQEPAKDRVAYREVKEYQKEPRPAEAIDRPVISKRKERKTRKASPYSFYAEPVPSASEDNEEAREAEDVEGTGDTEEHQVERENVQTADEEYDYTAATKPTYDKVLGLTLPRYMLTTSEHEAEFDEVVASSSI